MGNNPFTSTPSWTTDKTELKLDKNITYLGSVFGDNSKSGAAHSEIRVGATTKLYYGLQGAGQTPNSDDVQITLYLCTWENGSRHQISWCEACCKFRHLQHGSLKCAMGVVIFANI